MKNNTLKNKMPNSYNKNRKNWWFLLPFPFSRTLRTIWRKSSLYRLVLSGYKKNVIKPSFSYSYSKYIILLLYIESLRPQRVIHRQNGVIHRKGELSTGKMVNRVRGVGGNDNIMDLLDIWLGFPLTVRMSLFSKGKISGLEKVPVSQLFPEKKLVEGWMVDPRKPIL